MQPAARRPRSAGVSMPIRNTPFALSVVALIGLSAIAGATPAFAQPDIIREGEGARRRELDKMELKPFPAEAWSKLSDWTNGPALTPGVTSGKVVLIVTWADWYPASS